MTDASAQIEALRTALAVAEARAVIAEAELAEVARERAVLASAEATIAALRLEIEKLRRALYGTRSERKAVVRIDAVFDAERTINGLDADIRLAVRRREIAPLIANLEAWMRRERAGLSRHAPVAKATDYMLKRWDGFAGLLADGRVCLTNNAAERALRGIALGRKSWLFAGSDRGGERAAFMYGLITTAKLNDVDPQAWLADVIARIAGTPASQIDDLLPWSWTSGATANAA